MEVSGVRRSWDTARSRFARIFSRSLSARILSWAFSFVVRVPVITLTASIITADSMLSGTEKSNRKYGNVKA